CCGTCAPHPRVGCSSSRRPAPTNTHDRRAHPGVGVVGTSSASRAGRRVERSSPYPCDDRTTDCGQLQSSGAGRHADVRPTDTGGIPGSDPMRRRTITVGIGASIFMLAVGAIIAFALHVHVGFLDLSVVGWVLMVAGAVGLIMTLAIFNRRRTVVRDTAQPSVVQQPPVVQQPTTYARERRVVDEPVVSEYDDRPL